MRDVERGVLARLLNLGVEAVRFHFARNSGSRIVRPAFIGKSVLGRFRVSLHVLIEKGTLPTSLRGRGQILGFSGIGGFLVGLGRMWLG